MKITIDEREYEIILQFKMYHHGWELDMYGWIVNNNGNNRLVLTNHDDAYFADRNELERKITELDDAVSVMRTAIRMI